jgi:hypothetical protein
MFSSQINRALRADPNVSEYFLGVFSLDKLPSEIDYPCAMVVNTDPSHEKGEHWVAFHFDENRYGEYFDSYGKWPDDPILSKFLAKNGRIWCGHSVQLQGFNTTVCGQYCIEFLTRKCAGETMADIVERYSGEIPGQLDDYIGQRVNKKFNINMQSGGGGDSDSEYCGDEHYGEQCCCAERHCRRYRHCGGGLVKKWERLW